ncbi:MAG: hypothetical protein ACLQLC_20040 [Candidatus Sulfotelmatobacter sp.]
MSPSVPGGGAAILPITSPRLPTLRDPTENPPIANPPEPPRRPPIAPGPGFRHLVGSAGIIFTGRVVSIGRGRWLRDDASRTDSFAGPNASSTEITFLVEHALRGATQGQRLTIHQWEGEGDRLSTHGKRYYVGERLMLFLYAPSRLGLTSPVAGTMGRFAVDSRDQVLMSEQHRAVFANDPFFQGRKLIAYSEFERAVRRVGGKE